MNNITTKPGSPLRMLVPHLQKFRGLTGRFHGRTSARFIMNGGKARFMDAEINFPGDVGPTYLPPLFWDGSEAYEAPTSRGALAVIKELKYAMFAIASDGFFRMTGADFSHPRGLKDFLPVPREIISPNISCLALENVGEMFSA